MCINVGPSTSFCTVYCVILFGFSKGNTEHFVISAKLYQVFFWKIFVKKRDRKTIFTFIIDHGWRWSRLPRLARVL